MPSICLGPGPDSLPPDLLLVGDGSSCLKFSMVDPIVAERVKYNWEDPLNLESQLTEEEIAIR